MKEKSISQLKKEADRLCSLLVRQGGADWKGNARCFTCLVEKPWKELQAGHYVSRIYTNLRWHLPNIKIQCYSCNVMRRGNMDEFAIRLEKETPGILKVLNDWKHRSASKNTRQDLLVVVDEFKNKLKKL